MDTVNYPIVLRNIRNELKNYITEKHLKSLVLGVSGGIDSALVAAIAKPVCDELGITLFGASITIHTNKADEVLRAKMIGTNFCHEFIELNMNSQYDVLSSINKGDENGLSSNELIRWKIRNGNIKARLRMIYLYNLASTQNGIVLGTENLTEKYLGFFTIAGDETSDFEPILGLWKTEVYELSEWMIQNDLKRNGEKLALQSCIDAVATDGLGITNSDLDQILPNFQGSSRKGYENVDVILQNWIYNGQGDLSNPVIQRHINSDFKRKRPIVVKRELLF